MSTLRCPASVIASIPIEIVVHHGIFANALISSVSFLGFALFRQSSTIPVSCAPSFLPYVSLPNFHHPVIFLSAAFLVATCLVAVVTVREFVITPDRLL